MADIHSKGTTVLLVEQYASRALALGYRARARARAGASFGASQGAGEAWDWPLQRAGNARWH